MGGLWRDVLRWLALLTFLLGVAALAAGVAAQYELGRSVVRWLDWALTVVVISGVLFGLALIRRE